MNFNESVTLNTYSDKASKQFNEMQNRLSKIDNSFQTRMAGKTMNGLVGSFIGTFCWLAVFIALAIVINTMVGEKLLLIPFTIVVIGLVFFMLIDNIINFSYYGKISDYKNSVSQLQNRVNSGKNSIESNHEAFMKAKLKGWNFILNAGESIPEEAMSIESTMTNMESLKKGFVNSAKNVFYYAAVVIITIVGGISLFPISSKIMCGISKRDDLSSSTLLTLNIIALVLVGIGGIILAKVVWGKTNCSVTNVTLLILFFSPVAFLLLITIATLLVILVIGVAKILLYILGTVALLALFFACVSGG